MTTRFVRGLEHFERTSGERTVVTIGSFDGLHLGHMEILRRVHDEAARMGLQCVLVTFHPHPRQVVNPGQAPQLLTTVEEKEIFLPRHFDGDVVVLTFDERLKNLTAEEFVRSILVDRIGVKKLIVGYDHAFGRNRSGTVAELERLGKLLDYDVEVVGPVICDGHPVSSTRIRKALTDGKALEEGLHMLGHDYAIVGTVVRGMGLGRKLGYPTANVRYYDNKLLPEMGVYACRVQVAGLERAGMMFIGVNHFNPAESFTVEANLFDFDQDIYDERIIVYPTKYIRESRRFLTTDALVVQMGEDKKNVWNYVHKGERACQ